MIPCGLRYSMPVGLLGNGPYFFRIFKSSHKLENKIKDCLLLLAPLDASLFFKSVIHEFENEIDVLDLSELVKHGSLYACTPMLVGEAPEYFLYECIGLRPLHVASWTGYNRGYGCLLELLILYTRIRIGLIEPDIKIIKYLINCIKRSNPGGNLDNIAKRVLQLIQKHMR